MSKQSKQKNLTISQIISDQYPTFHNSASVYLAGVLEYLIALTFNSYTSKDKSQLEVSCLVSSCPFIDIFSKYLTDDDDSVDIVDCNIKDILDTEGNFCSHIDRIMYQVYLTCQSPPRISKRSMIAMNHIVNNFCKVVVANRKKCYSVDLSVIDVHIILRVYIFTNRQLSICMHACCDAGTRALVSIVDELSKNEKNFLFPQSRPQSRRGCKYDLSDDWPTLFEC